MTSINILEFLKNEQANSLKQINQLRLDMDMVDSDSLAVFFSLRGSSLINNSVKYRILDKFIVKLNSLINKHGEKEGNEQFIQYLNKPLKLFNELDYYQDNGEITRLIKEFQLNTIMDLQELSYNKFSIQKS